MNSSRGVHPRVFRHKYPLHTRCLLRSTPRTWKPQKTLVTFCFVLFSRQRRVQRIGFLFHRSAAGLDQKGLITNGCNFYRSASRFCKETLTVRTRFLLLFNQRHHGNKTCGVPYRLSPPALSGPSATLDCFLEAVPVGASKVLIFSGLLVSPIRQIFSTVMNL